MMPGALNIIGIIMVVIVDILLFGILKMELNDLEVG